MGIRLDELDPTASPQRDHVIPAMRDGLTVRLTLAQVLALIAADDGAMAGKQPLDATLTALAALAGEADKLPYFTGADALALADITAAARTLLAAANQAAQRTALGATTTGAALFTAADPAAARSTLGATATGSSLFTAADPAAARSTLAAPWSPASGAATVIQAINTAAVLPAGGTWFFFVIGFNTNTGTWLGRDLLASGVNAGGATIGYGAAGRSWVGFAWRIA